MSVLNFVPTTVVNGGSFPVQLTTSFAITYGNSDSKHEQLRKEESQSLLLVCTEMLLHKRSRKYRTS